MDIERLNQVKPTPAHQEVIDAVSAAWAPLCEARIALDVTLREESKLRIFFTDDHLEHSTVNLGHEYRRERLITHLNDVFYYDDVASAKYLHGGVGVSNYTLNKARALNVAKRRFQNTLPGHAAKIGGLSFNRYLANLLEPDSPRLNFLALTRQIPIILNKDPDIDDTVVQSLVSVSIGTFIHTRAEHISLDKAYKFVGGFSKALNVDSVSLLNQLPSKTGNKKMDVVVLKNKKGRVKTQAKISYYNASTNKKHQKPVKVALPLFYSVEDNPDLVVKVSQTNAPRKPEHRNLTRDRLAFASGDYEIYRCLPGDPS